MRTREEHLEWCKEQARPYLRRGELEKAVVRFVGDMLAHEETAIPTEGALAQLTVFALIKSTEGNHEFIERYIEGFR